MKQKQSQKSVGIYFRILGYLKPYFRKLILVILCNFGFILFSTLSMWMIAPVITVMFNQTNKQTTVQTSEQKMIVPQQSADQESSGTSVLNLNEWLKENIQDIIPKGDPIHTLQWLCIVIFLAFLIKNIFSFIEFYMMTYIEQSVVKDLREQVYEKIIFQSLGFFHKHKTGDLISNITNDINSVNVAVNRSFTKIIRDPIMIVVFMVILFNISWQLTLVAMIVLPLTTLIIRKISNSLRRRSKRVQEKIADITSVLQETISGIKVVKAFAMENYENNKFRKRTGDHFLAVIRQIRSLRLASPISEVVGVAVMVGVILYGGALVLAGGSIHAEDFMRFLLILFAILEPLKSLAEVNNNIQVALASGKRIFDLIDEPILVTEKKDVIPVNSFNNTIVYENVDFRYNPGGELILKNINFKVNKNQKVALVGSSGAGKTTMLNLLPRFYDVESGTIKIDGENICNFSLASLRSLMGIVTQEVILFDDTVKNNIAYGVENYNMEQIERAADLANATQFIKELPKGFNTIIGERGMFLSGGQRQRISIARAILKNPPILIFDEATSSLDSESEFLIQQAMENLMKDRTVIIVAHRFSSIINSDKIFLFDDGKIIDEGTNNELQKRSERYRQLYKMQFSDEIK